MTMLEKETGEKDVMGRFGIQGRNAKGQMVVDFAKKVEMPVVDTVFQKRQEHKVTYKSGGRSTSTDGCRWTTSPPDYP